MQRSQHQLVSPSWPKCVAQSCNICRPVGCRPVGDVCSLPSRPSPSWSLAQMTDDLSYCHPEKHAVFLTVCRAFHRWDPESDLLKSWRRRWWILVWNLSACSSSACRQWRVSYQCPSDRHTEPTISSATGKDDGLSSCCNTSYRCGVAMGRGVRSLRENTWGEKLCTAVKFHEMNISPNIFFITATLC